MLRREYNPESTLFVVQQQGHERFSGDGSFASGRDYGDVFTTPSTNTFLVTRAYWLSP